jgi:hypothetical protein
MIPTQWLERLLRVKNRGLMVSCDQAEGLKLLERHPTPFRLPVF